jgi:hypothetical protein
MNTKYKQAVRESADILRVNTFPMVLPKQKPNERQQARDIVFDIHTASLKLTEIVTLFFNDIYEWAQDESRLDDYNDIFNHYKKQYTHRAEYLQRKHPNTIINSNYFEQTFGPE